MKHVTDKFPYSLAGDKSAALVVSQQKQQATLSAWNTHSQICIK